MLLTSKSPISDLNSLWTTMSPEFCSMESAACLNCAAKNPPHYCSACNLARYCHAQCQREHWKLSHKYCCGMGSLEIIIEMIRATTDSTTLDPAYNIVRICITTQKLAMLVLKSRIIPCILSRLQASKPLTRRYGMSVVWNVAAFRRDAVQDCSFVLDMYKLQPDTFMASAVCAIISSCLIDTKTSKKYESLIRRILKRYNESWILSNAISALSTLNLLHPVESFNADLVKPFLMHENVEVKTNAIYFFKTTRKLTDVFEIFELYEHSVKQPKCLCESCVEIKHAKWCQDIACTCAPIRYQLFWNTGQIDWKDE